MDDRERLIHVWKLFNENGSIAEEDKFFVFNLHKNKIEMYEKETDSSNISLATYIKKLNSNLTKNVPVTFSEYFKNAVMNGDKALINNLLYNFVLYSSYMSTAYRNTRLFDIYSQYNNRLIKLICRVFRNINYSDTDAVEFSKQFLLYNNLDSGKKLLDQIGLIYYDDLTVKDMEMIYDTEQSFFIYPDIWGSMVWTLLHAMAHKIDTDRDFESRVVFITMLNEYLDKLLYCPDCVRHYFEYLLPEIKKINDSDSLSNAIYKIHNINRRLLNKEPFSESDFSKYKRNLRKIFSTKIGIKEQK